MWPGWDTAILNKICMKNHHSLCLKVSSIVSANLIFFYLRPVLAFGYCRCLRPSVSPSVTKFFRAITYHPFKLGSHLDHSCKRPWLRSLLLLGWLTVTFKVNFNFKVKIYPSLSLSARSPVQARATKFGPEVLNTFVKIPVVLEVDWAWHVKFNLFSKSCLFASLLRLWNICETYKKTDEMIIQ